MIIGNTEHQTCAVRIVLFKISYSEGAVHRVKRFAEGTLLIYDIVRLVKLLLINCLILFKLPNLFTNFN